MLDLDSTHLAKGDRIALLLPICPDIVSSVLALGFLFDFYQKNIDEVL